MPERWGSHSQNKIRIDQMERAVRAIFLILYLAVDIIYVLLSKSYYEKTIIAIQGSGLPGGRVPDALLAYTIIGVGWLVVATPSVKLWIEKGYRPLAAGAAAGGTYGLVVYGIYNWTLRAEFENYGLGVAVRDTCWGITSCAVMVALYAHRAYAAPPQADTEGLLH